jgi:pyrroline-5-carboxylate reductase
MKLSFIGTGNMGGAIIKGCLASSAFAPTDIAAYDKDAEKLTVFAQSTGILARRSISSAIVGADIIFLAVKPMHFDDVLTQLATLIKPEQTALSMGAGISIAYIESFLGAQAKIVRIMPNTPAMVGESMTAVSRNKNITDSAFEDIVKIFSAIGKAQAVDESFMDTVTGISGSSPAYAYMFIDALAKAGMANGMDADSAKLFAAQATLGAAKMVLETGIDPVQLRINVCSPGGTTIEAVQSLQTAGFEEIIARATQAAIEKSKAMTR